MTAGFEIDAGAERVCAWSDFRLPFEPKGEAHRFREELRQALRGLSRRPTLHAAYTSRDGIRCDVENVALYNVGAGPFRGLGTASIRVERLHGTPPPAPSGARRPHFVEYRAASTQSGWVSWHPTGTLVEWTGRSMAGPLTASSVWAAFRRGRAAAARAWDGRAPLGVEVRIESQAGLGLISSVKSLVDGIVAAAHAHDGTDGDVVARRLAATVGLAPEETADLLMRDQGAVLGTRRLLNARAGGVQWNPADDSVVAIRLSRVPSAAGGTRVTAAIHVVGPPGRQSP